MVETDARPRSTLPGDPWWLESPPVVAALSAFDIYARFRTLEGIYYEWNPDLSLSHLPPINWRYHQVLYQGVPGRHVHLR